MDNRARSHHTDRGAVNTSLVVWIMAIFALAALFAGLGWAGVFDSGDEEGTTAPPATIEPTDWTGVVVDSITGEPLGGVTVTPTDVTGAPISSLAVVTAADGSYTLPGLTLDEYGLSADGSLVAHEQGWVASTSGPLGHLVVQAWGDAATFAPGVFGDIALDPIEVPVASTSTSPSSSAAPTTIAPTTTAANHGPDIGVLDVSPISVSPSAFCGPTEVDLSVAVTDPDGVGMVNVEWSYPSDEFGVPGTASGSETLSRDPGTDTWRGTLSFWKQPWYAITDVTLKVVAHDTRTMRRSRTFDSILTIERC
jgi:hypothetical protein